MFFFSNVRALLNNYMSVTEAYAIYKQKVWVYIHPHTGVTKKEESDITNRIVNEDVMLYRFQEITHTRH